MNICLLNNICYSIRLHFVLSYDCIFCFLSIKTRPPVFIFPIFSFLFHISR